MTYLCNFRVTGHLSNVFDNCIDYIFKVTKSVIEDFEQDNVKYLELRSTPRANPETGIGIKLNIRSQYYKLALSECVEGPDEKVFGSRS